MTWNNRNIYSLLVIHQLLVSSHVIVTFDLLQPKISPRQDLVTLAYCLAPF